MQLAMFSQPVCDRLIYKLVKKHKCRSFIEIGLDDGKRCESIIRVAGKYGASPNIRYTGVDHFDAREPNQPKLQLIDTHRQLKTTNAKIQLVPGDLHSAIARIANSHVRTDMIIISAGFEPQSLAESWFYFPRMLHSGSLVLLQEVAGAAFKTMSRLEVEKLAEPMSPRRSAAA